MTEREILSRLSDTPEDLTVRVVNVCDSTNTRLKAEAASIKTDAVLIARRQTGGRGRLGRSFFSPEDTGLYMSLLLRPTFSGDSLTLITPAAAVAVCRALERVYGVKAGIKWVNDVILNGKKICGILTEAVFTPGGALSHVVLGVGVNVAPPPGGFPAELSAGAGAVLTAPAPETMSALAAAVISEFYRIYSALPSYDLAAAYAPRLLYVGGYADVRRGDCSRRALVLGADDRCRLLVRYDDGTSDALSGGEITIRPAREPRQLVEKG